MAEYRLSPRAQQDLDGIFDYTVTHWGLPQALRHVDDIEAACAGIRRGYRRRSVGQHFIYFQRADFGIAIVRILHQRMDQPRHL